jgi:hypothetical protein
MITSSIAEKATLSWVRCVRTQPGRRTGASSSPSNLRIAVAIAEFRRAGRGGGGVGSQSEVSFSAAMSACH